MPLTQNLRLPRTDCSKSLRFTTQGCIEQCYGNRVHQLESGLTKDIMLPNERLCE